MFKSLIRKSVLTLFVLALTIGTVFAQDGGVTSSSSPLTLATLLLGITFIGLIFIVNWGRSAPEETDE